MKIQLRRLGSSAATEILVGDKSGHPRRSWCFRLDIGKAGLILTSYLLMRLYVLRHGDAEYDAPDDHARRLSARGESTVRQLGLAVRPREFQRVTGVWHSPLVRAIETAELLRDACGLTAPLLTKPGMQPEDDPVPLCAEFAEREADLILVGHNPHLTFLAAHLLTGRANQASIVFKKAGLLCLERVGPPTANLPGGHWALCFFLIPRVTGLHEGISLPDSE